MELAFEVGRVGLPAGARRINAETRPGLLCLRAILNVFQGL